MISDETIPEEKAYAFFPYATACASTTYFNDTASIRSALKPSRWTENPVTCTSPTNSIKTNVSFDSVDIREFPMTIGHNPSALGPPVQLDYENFSANKNVSLEEYEEARKPRRSSRQLRLSRRRRHVILREERNLPQTEINQAAKEAHDIRRQRSETHRQSWIAEKMDEATESAHRKFLRCMACNC
jgi:hypothetical protein